MMRITFHHEAVRWVVNVAVQFVECIELKISQICEYVECGLGGAELDGRWCLVSERYREQVANAQNLTFHRWQDCRRAYKGCGPFVVPLLRHL
jgi:hypothetical protein